MKDTKKMSEFCESLMSVTEKLEAGANDCALVMCSDKKTLACRIKGNMIDVYMLLLRKMKVDVNFAECILNVSAAYSLQLLRDRNLAKEKEVYAKMVSLGMKPENKDGNGQG